MEPYVDERLQWRALTPADLEDLAALRSQIELLDDPLITGVDRMVQDSDIATMAMSSTGGWDDYGNLLAYGWNIARPDGILSVHLLGGVHPTHRHMGIGRRLLQWQVDNAMEFRALHHPDMDLWLGCYVDQGHPGLGKALRGLHFTRERFFYDMHRELTHLPTLREVPGIDVVGFDPSYSEAVRTLHNLCFADPQAPREISRQAWDALLVRDSFRSGWSWVALADGRPVGYAMSGVDEVVAADDEIPDDVVVGWTGQLGVDPAFRGRGIALALLSRTLRSMAADGCAMAGLGVDTTDPASPALLARELGYEARDGLELMSRFLPA